MSSVAEHIKRSVLEAPLSVDEPGTMSGCLVEVSEKRQAWWTGWIWELVCILGGRDEIESLESNV